MVDIGAFHPNLVSIHLMVFKKMSTDGRQMDGRWTPAP